MILLFICGCLLHINLARTCDESTVRVGILCSAAGYIWLHQIYEQVNFYKKPQFSLSLVGPSDSGNTYLIQQCSKFGTFQTKFEKIYFFHQHLQPLYDVMRKEIDNLEFVQGVHFAFINSLKKNGTKYLLFFDDSCAEICNSKEFVDIATAGKHRGFSTIYIKHNLFHQSKLGRDVELQSTHIFLFKSPQDVHQVAIFRCTVGTRISSRWLVMGCNVCTFCSFVDWFVSTNRRSITMISNSALTGS